MPDPSAGRPLPLPNQDLEALELLLLEPCNVECMFYRPNSAACPGCSAVAILRHFGPRLLPPSAEHREEEEEFMVAGDLPDGTPWVSDPHHRLGDARQLAAMMAPGAVIKRRLVSAGPWVEVEGRPDGV